MKAEIKGDVINITPDNYGEYLELKELTNKVPLMGTVYHDGTIVSHAPVRVATTKELPSAHEAYKRGVERVTGKG